MRHVVGRCLGRLEAASPVRENSRQDRGAPMQEFVDLTGASGASYRFRLLAPTATPSRMGGNYAAVQVRGGGVRVLGVGATNDLSQVREALAGVRGASIYIRLNVSRQEREAEHEDLAARYPAASAAH